MSIPVEHEDVEELKKWGMGLSSIQEQCTFCSVPTRYWHTDSNNPCCEACAATHDVADLP